jgi:hypothetical protein
VLSSVVKTEDERAPVKYENKELGNNGSIRNQVAIPLLSYNNQG